MIEFPTNVNSGHYIFNFLSQDARISQWGEN